MGTVVVSRRADPVAVRAELERILASETFRRAGRAAAFLRFVTENTLNGEGEKLKEYLIALEVFQRPSSYDPRIDSIVRVEAGKLRSRLAKYYATEGKKDEIVLSLPKGGYAIRIDEGRNGAPSRRRYAIGLALALTVLALLATAIIRRVDREQSLAVLPFENGLNDPEDQYLVDGLSEDITNSLSRRRGLLLTARATAFRYRGKQGDIRKVAADLNVGTVLSGRLMQRGDRLVVQAELVDRAGSQLWGRQFEGARESAFSLADQVARAVAGELGIDHRSRAAIPANDEAYHAYLKGRFFWNKRSADGFRRAIAYFTEAIRIDPNFAPAYAGLSDAYGAACWYGSAAASEVLPKAREAARKALELAGETPEAHLALRRIAIHSGDNEGAGKEATIALRLDPDNLDALRGMGLYELWSGRVAESERWFRRAYEQDPVSLGVNINVGEYLYYARQYERAVQQYRKTIEMDPTFFWAHERLGQAYEQMGRYDDAIAAYRRAIELNGDSRVVDGALGHAYAASGRTEEARKLLDRMLSRARTEYVSPYGIAMVHAGLGNTDAVFEWLARACEDRSAWLVWLKVDPRLDAIRGDARFAAVLRKAGGG